MTTAIDTNIFSALWSVEPFATEIAAALDRAGRDEKSISCGAVYAELLAHPNATPEFIDSFFRTTRVALEFGLTADIWREGGRRFALYAQRRKRRGAEPKRLLVDFVVGAHALLRADRLFTSMPPVIAAIFPSCG